VGQPHVVRTLTNQLRTNRPNHAYLFCGTRGTGKTTCAKIFAKAVNCTDRGEDGEPCGVCESCMAIESGRSVNAVEIDAASNNGVDNVRDIREELRFAPVEGSYKVYIIDEVHMLSSGAFNALLKTLEEPPAHVIFILATTDPQKIPATILSRCQRFDFRRVTPGEIAGALTGYIAGEGLEADVGALSYIARAADGSMRDALSILDRCAALYYGERLTEQMVQNVMGAADRRVFFELAGAVAARDCAKALDVAGAAFASGLDAGLFAADFALHLRDLLVIMSVGGGSAFENARPDISPDRAAALAAQAADFSRGELLRLIDIFTAVSGQIRYAQSERLALEVGCIKACNPPPAAGPPDEAGGADQKFHKDPESAALQALEKRLRKLESALESGALRPAPAAGAGEGSGPPAAPAPKKIQKAAPKAAAPEKPAPTPDELRRALHSAADSFNPFYRTMLKTLKPVPSGGGALVFAAPDAVTAANLNSILDSVTAAMKALGFDQPIKFVTEAADAAGHKHEPARETGRQISIADFTNSGFEDIIEIV